MNIGAAIKKLRLAKRWTQDELAERANTSKPNISNLERGAQGYSPVILTSLARAFGIRVSEIFQLAEELEESEKLAGLDESDTSPMSDGVITDLDEWIFLYEKLPPKKQAALLLFVRTWIGDKG